MNQAKEEEWGHEDPLFESLNFNKMQKKVVEKLDNNEKRRIRIIYLPGEHPSHSQHLGEPNLPHLLYLFFYSYTVTTMALLRLLFAAAFSRRSNSHLEKMWAWGGVVSNLSEQYVPPRVTQYSCLGREVADCFEGKGSSLDAIRRIRDLKTDSFDVFSFIEASSFDLEKTCNKNNQLWETANLQIRS